ncbi:MAG TPA: hypothetical protein VIL48_19235 [Acidimicrobiales bacterium]
MSDDRAPEPARGADDPAPGPGVSVPPGDRIVQLDLWATVLFAVVQALAAGLPDAFSALSVAVSVALFLVGAVAFVWGFLLAIGRSRYEAVTLSGLFFLGEDAAPAGVRRTLRLLLLAQVIVAVAAAAVRPFTELAFGILAPMLGTGLLALWGARHGVFAPRDESAEPGGARQ